MKIILASNNKGKLKELKEYMSDYEVFGFTEILKPFEIVEDAKSFKENALIKARAVYEKLQNKDEIVLSDDSGISVEVLGGKPGIYSARYAGDSATSEQNLDKLIKTLKQKKLKSSPAFYTAAIAIVCKKGEFCVHGWMHGNVIDEKRGTNGFGYDPIFIPLGYDNTLGELGDEIKKEFSHRSNALNLAKIILKTL
ncbi:MAG: RdgB/HAM1 family non-canonical purine NTP pyrophosphatase [Campylobacteraceae bacterium]|nr:RdgB/HAM1 family non-canonical purine NTP pyrophosphatase [Campylobacteraceae bacterium]